MSGNSFGNLFRVLTFGESHGHSVGVVIDGCPANIPISIEHIQRALNRRRPGQSLYTSPRDESDQLICMSGLEKGKSLGSSICLSVKNKDYRKKDYDELNDLYRPSHADYTYEMKYGIRSKSGGGRSSARETLARVAAGALAEQMLKFFCPKLEVIAFTQSIRNLSLKNDLLNVSKDEIYSSQLRCPDKIIEAQMKDLLNNVQKTGDTLGGVISGQIRNCPVGFGEPVFDKLEADLAKAMLSIPASKGFEVGEGFSSTLMLGSEHNDIFINKSNEIRTKTNHSGGIQGGISNGEHINFRVAFKPVSTLFKKQMTVNKFKENIPLKLKSGRHDPCVLPRAVSVVEAMAYLVLAENFLKYKARKLI